MLLGRLFNFKLLLNFITNLGLFGLLLMLFLYLLFVFLGLLLGGVDLICWFWLFIVSGRFSSFFDSCGGRSGYWWFFYLSRFGLSNWGSFRVMGVRLTMFWLLITGMFLLFLVILFSLLFLLMMVNRFSGWLLLPDNTFIVEICCTDSISRTRCWLGLYVLIGWIMI